MLEFIRPDKNGSIISPETIFRYGLMMIALLIMVARLNHVVEYCFVGLLVIWGGVKLARRDFHFVRTPLDIPIVLFVVWVLATIPFSVDPAYSFAEWRRTVIKILMFYFVVNVVSKEQDVRHILLAFMLGVVSLSTFGIIDHLASGGSFFDKSSYAGSLASSGQWISVYLVMSLPLLWFFFQEREGKQTAWYIGIILVVLMTALFLSHIRSGWVAFFAQLATLWLISVHSARLKWGVAVTAGGVIAIGGTLLNVFQSNLLTNASSYSLSLLSFSTLKIRFELWQIAIQHILARPVLGYGYGNETFQKVNELMNKEMFVSADFSRFFLTHYPHIHNRWLSLAYEVGLIGLALFALILFVIIRTTMREVAESRGTFLGNLGLYILLLVVGVITCNMFDNMFIGSLAYLFWLLTGLYFALSIRRDQAPSPPL